MHIPLPIDFANGLPDGRSNGPGVPNLPGMAGPSTPLEEPPSEPAVLRALIKRREYLS